MRRYSDKKTSCLCWHCLKLLIKSLFQADFLDNMLRQNTFIHYYTKYVNILFQLVKDFTQTKSTQGLDRIAQNSWTYLRIALFHPASLVVWF